MANQAKVSSIYIDLVARTAAFKQALGEATNETKKFAAQTRAQMEEAKGSIALLGEEVGVHLPRHLRTFVAELPGVAKAMSAAFEAVAVIALISVVVEAGKKVAEFATKNREAAEKLKTAQEEFGLTVQKTYNSYGEKLLEAGIRTDELRNNHVAALQKQLELIDMQGFNALESAFKSLESAADKTFDSIKTNWLSVMSQFSFADAAGFKGTLGRFGTEYSSLLLSGKADEAQNLLNQVQQREEQNRADLTLMRSTGLRTDSSGLFFTDKQHQDALARLRSRGITDYSDETYNAATQTTSALEAQQNIVGYQNKLTEADKSNTRIEAGKKGDAELLSRLEKAIETREALHGKSVSEEATYWEKYLSTFKVGSEQWLAVQKAFLSSQDALQKNFTEPGKLKKGINAFNDSQAGDGPKSTGRSDAITSATAKAAVEQAELNAEWTLASDKLGFLTGAVTAHQVAMDTAAAHTAEYHSELVALQQQLAQFQKENPFEVDERQIGVQSQIDALNSKVKIQAMEDAQATLSTTWTGMIDNVWDTLIKRAQDTQQELGRIAVSTIDSLNSELAKGVMGGKMDLSKVFMNSAQSLAKTGLQTAEGFGLKALGLGGKTKHDGSSADSALFVHDVSGGLKGLDTSMFKGAVPHVSGPAAGLVNKAGGGLLGMLNNSNWASSLFGGRLFGSGSVFGGFATGGDVTYGGVYPVGELGPEQVYLPGGSHVVPNKDVHSGGPSIGYIDARGTDPVQTHMAVARGMQIAYSQAVRDSQKKMADRQRRRA